MFFVLVLEHHSCRTSTWPQCY